MLEKIINASGGAIWAPESLLLNLLSVPSWRVPPPPMVNSLISNPTLFLFSQMLPEEIIISIFSYLTVAELGRAGSVCKVWFRLASEAVEHSDHEQACEPPARDAGTR